MMQAFISHSTTCDPIRPCDSASPPPTPRDLARPNLTPFPSPCAPQELKRSGSYRPQLDLYKKQVGELHEQLSEETKKRDKADFELRKLGERMTALQSEKEVSW